MYRTQTLERYLTDAASGQPTPGGGSVSALVGALAASMAAMAANFTIGKKKFAAVEHRVRAHLEKVESLRERLLQLVDEDVNAYGCVSEAFALPRVTEEQKHHRTQAIQNALVAALTVPRQIVESSCALLEVLTELVDVANPNLISDVGVAAVLAQAALKGGKLNVEINLAALKNTALVERVRNETNQAATAASRRAADVLAKVRASIALSSSQ